MRNVKSLARKTGCRTANTLPARCVARNVPGRAVVRPTTQALVTANAILAQAALSARLDACPVSAQELFDLFRKHDAR
jgi:hypothetical protein